jgi:hypothetical protein
METYPESFSGRKFEKGTRVAFRAVFWIINAGAQRSHNATQIARPRIAGS